MAPCLDGKMAYPPQGNFPPKWLVMDKENIFTLPRKRWIKNLKKKYRQNIEEHMVSNIGQIVKYFTLFQGMSLAGTK